MTKLNRLIASCKTTEADAVSDRLFASYSKDDWSSDAHLTNLFSELKSASDILTSSINKIAAESTLEEKDELRDAKIKAFGYFLMGFLYSPDQAMRSAAEKVNSVFSKYGNEITRESYATETSLIESLLIDLADTELQDSINALPGLSVIISEIRTAQTEFEDAKVKYEEEKAKLGAELTASEIKKDVVGIINNKIVVYLRAMVQVNESKYGSLTQNVAQIIDDMNIIVRKRRNDKTSTDEEQN